MLQQTEKVNQRRGLQEAREQDIQPRTEVMPTLRKMAMSKPRVMATHQVQRALSLAWTDQRLEKDFS